MKARRSLIQTCLLCAAMLQALNSGAQPVTTIAQGGTTFHSLFLKSNGSLWAMGQNTYGELGDGTASLSPPGKNRPEQIMASNVTAIAAGWRHSLFLKNDGSLWATGYNAQGQLGDGTYNGPVFPASTDHPEQIVASNVTAIAAGSEHSLFLKSNGSLWGMGDNGAGALGDGTYNPTNLPEQIVASNVTAIAVGGGFSLFIKSGGSLWAMGYNVYGELGDGTYNMTNLPEQIVASNVTAIATGEFHSLFLKSDGSLWAMGYNADGELGDGTTNSYVNQPDQIVASNVTAIAAGYSHSIFLKSDGSLWGMGNNGGGELGDGTYNNTNLPEQIVASGVTTIAAGRYHNLFLKGDGSLWGMGTNTVGQLGDGTFNNSTNRPEQILAAYNQISSLTLSGGKMRLFFVGIATNKYALDWSSSLSPPINWIPQVTNSASSYGAMVFTNTPVLATNNFWRIRSVP